MSRWTFLSLAAFLAYLTVGQSFSFALVSAGFIQNRGQLDSRVLYYATGKGVAVYLTSDAVVLDLHERTQRPRGGEDAPRISGPRDPSEMDGNPWGYRTPGGCAVYIRFEGTDPMAPIEARGELAGKYNFFSGNDPERWRTDVPSFSEVVYRDAWLGVDMIWRLEDGDLSCELVSQAISESGPARGVDPLARFKYEGADAVLGEDGSIYLETPVGLLVEEPSARNRNRVRFRRKDSWDRDIEELGTRDNPSTLLFSTFLGGSSDDMGYAISLDSSDDPVVTGETASTDFPTTPGAYDESFNGDVDLFVVKLDATGNTLLWSTFLGGGDSDGGYAVSLDASGNPVVTGWTWSSDFPTTPGACDETFNGAIDLFLTKLDGTEGTLLYGTFLGGSDYDIGYAVSLDSSGNSVVTGDTWSWDFPTTPGAYDETSNGFIGAFVAKLDSTGSTLLWSTFLGGSSSDYGYAVSLDASGDPVVTGKTWSTDFPTTPGAYDETHNGYYDVFVAKLDATGSTLLWSTFLGGSASAEEGGHAISLDASGNPVLTGWTASPDFPTTQGAYDETFNGGYVSGEGDGFVAKLDATGSTLLWSTFLGGSYDDLGYALSLDASGNPVVTGETQSFDFPTTPWACDESFNGWSDLFVVKFDSMGSRLLYGTFLGGSYYDYGYALSLDASGNPVVTGETWSSDFPTTPGAYDESQNGGYADAFVTKLGINDVVEVTIVPLNGQEFQPGDGVEYNVTITNLLADPQNVTAEVYATDEPTLQIPLQGPVTFTLGGGMSVSRDIGSRIPYNAPPMTVNICAEANGVRDCYPITIQ